jgi:hypothetical protein
MGPGEIGRSRGGNRRLPGDKIGLNPGHRKSFAAIKTVWRMSAALERDGHKSPVAWGLLECSEQSERFAEPANLLPGHGSSGVSYPR